MVANYGNLGYLWGFCYGIVVWYLFGSLLVDVCGHLGNALFDRFLCVAWASS